MKQQTTFISTAKVTAPLSLIKQAKNAAVAQVVIANAGAPLPMQAAHQATKIGLMTPLFIGVKADIKREANKLDWDISKFEIVEADDEQTMSQTAVAVCRDGRGDILMKGHLHTDIFMQAIINKNSGLHSQRRLVHVFYMSDGDSKPLLISDAALNVAPNLATRKVAIRHCINILHRLENPYPNIAILSATESVIASIPSSQEAQYLAQWGRDLNVQANISGPLAMDLIFSHAAARIKGLIKDPVAGNTDAIIVPDIVTGNALFKTLVYTKSACAAGLVMGAKIPILLTSRADTTAARLASIALAAIIR